MIPFFPFFRRRKHPPAVSTPAAIAPPSIMAIPMQQPLTRFETVVFSFTFDKTNAETHAEALAVLGPHIAAVPKTLREGDRLDVRYAIDIAYFGDVVKKLDALHVLLNDPAVPVAVQVEEIRQGRCVILDMLRSLDAAIEQIKNRGAL